LPVSLECQLTARLDFSSINSTVSVHNDRNNKKDYLFNNKRNVDKNYNTIKFIKSAIKEGLSVRNQVIGMHMNIFFLLISFCTYAVLAGPFSYGDRFYKPLPCCNLLSKHHHHHICILYVNRYVD
jgi:hypothetical protein